MGAWGSFGNNEGNYRSYGVDFAEAIKEKAEVRVAFFLCGLKLVPHLLHFSAPESCLLVHW